MWDIAEYAARQLGPALTTARTEDLAMWAHIQAEMSGRIDVGHEPILTGARDP